MKPISVAVTALKTVESPQPGFAVARSLKYAGYKVIGIDDSYLTSAIIASYFDAVYITNSLKTENFNEFKKILMKIKDKEGIDILIPCYDKDVFFFAKYKKEIENIGIKLLLPSSYSIRQASKPYLAELRKYGILIPKTLLISKENEIDIAIKTLGLPLVCKGILKDAYIAKDSSEVLIFFSKIRDIWSGGEGSVILQEFLFGEYYCISGVADYKSKIKRYTIMKKLAIDSKGTTWSGLTITNNRIKNIADHIIECINWIGPFELEFVRDHVTKKYYLFEINPRFPSWIYLATAAGQNLPKILVDILYENKINGKSFYKNNLMFTRLANEITYPMNKLRTGKFDNVKIIDIEV
ncbi:MAG: hypothetical protein J4431_00825 [Candidatus Aenigmarchaeota archaeon]|nr:hypothetical protein [Candidatus Aenigmarchaeota archaeon]